MSAENTGRTSAKFNSLFSLTAAEQERIKIYDKYLLEIAAVTNLLSRASLDVRWNRHYTDSAQLLAYIPEDAKTLVDVGSGAGFPGLILAALVQDRHPDMHFTLVESVGKKSRFLRNAAKKMGLTNVTVSGERAEVFHVKHLQFDVVMARAVSALHKLLPLTVPLLNDGGLLLLPKGENAPIELTKAALQWTFEHESHPSMTHDRASILLMRNLECIA